MNVGPAWQKGYTGKGIVVSILDDGIQTNHPDLAINYVSSVVFKYFSGTVMCVLMMSLQSFSNSRVLIFLFSNYVGPFSKY